MRRCAAALALALLTAVGGTWLGSSLRLGWLAQAPLLPTRFDHKYHQGVSCLTCHHNFRERRLGTKPCLACHKAWGTTEARRIDSMFHAFCADCHRRERAAGRKAGPVKACAACHVRHPR